MGARPKYVRHLLTLVALAGVVCLRPSLRLIPGTAAKSELVRSLESGHLYSLGYDQTLGVWGESDHVGDSYTFAREALAVPAPGPFVALGLEKADLVKYGIQGLPAMTTQEVDHSEGARDTHATVAVDLNHDLWTAYTSFRSGDEDIYVRERSPEGEWGKEVQLSHSPLADFNPAIGVDQNGWVWVVWSRQKNAQEWPLVAAHFDGKQWAADEEIVAGRNYLPTLARNKRSGELWLAWEDWSTGTSQVRSAKWSGKEWSSFQAAPADSLPHQHPTLASGDDGAVWLAYDVVENDKYDVRLANWQDGTWKAVNPPPAIEGHRRKPAIDVDHEGRVWLLAETLVQEPVQDRRAFYGIAQYFNVRPPSRAMLVWSHDRWKAISPGPLTSSEEPSLHIDRNGTVWIITREISLDQHGFSAVGVRYRGDHWFTSSLQGPAWSPESANREFVVGGQDITSDKERLSFAEDGDFIYLAQTRSHRRLVMQPAFTFTDAPVDTVVTSFPLESKTYVEADAVDFDTTLNGTSSPEVTPLPHADPSPERAEVAVDGQQLGVYYGDLHHHTEFSRDPGLYNDDGDSNYRYWRDIRKLDFTGLTDHVEHLSDYDWYRMRRTAAFYDVVDRFAAFVGFEWSSEFYRNGNFQWGHHNVIYRTDGPEVHYYSASLPGSNTPGLLTHHLSEDIAQAAKQGVETGAIVIPHDPNRWVQPLNWSWYNPHWLRLIELVQSRGSHEMLGGPQHFPLVNDLNLVIGHSVQDGLAHNFQWGFIGSGDHFGRPIAGVFASAGERHAIFDAMFARRTFATTGARMVVSLSVNGHFMGTAWKGNETEHTLDVYARGTKPIMEVVIWKDNRIIYRWSPPGAGLEPNAGAYPSSLTFRPEREFTLHFKDPSAPYFRENWWYVRVTQQDGEIAWSSPVWFVYEPISPRVIADAGGRQSIYIMPQFAVPVPILMRNQKEQTVKGQLKLLNVPAGWKLAPDGAIDFTLPPDSWTTYVWNIHASEESVKELKAIPVELQVTYADGTQEFKSLAVIQSPKVLDTHYQLSELNDALYLQHDVDTLNAWLNIMAKRWGLTQ